MRFRNLQIPIVFFLVTGLFISCNKKYQKDYVKGTVTDGDSGSPLSHATVILESTEAGVKSYDSVYTNHDGKFDFPGKRLKRNGSYDLIFRDNSHFGYRSVGLGVNNNEAPYNVPLANFAYFKLRVKKNLNDSNFLYVNVMGVPITGVSFLFKKYQPFDTILPQVLRTPAGLPTQLSWQVSGPPDMNGVFLYNRFGTTVIVNKGDTLTYLVQYN